MLNKLWGFMILIGILFAAATGKIGEIGTAALDSSKEAVTLCITMLGIMSMWTGLMNIAKKAGIIDALTKALRPVLAFLFPGVPKEHKANEYMAANMISNVLGLGWAATPVGLKAMEELKKLNHGSHIASADMCTFLIINISSLQLIPVNIIAYRSQYGSASPASILGMGLVATIVSTAAGVIFSVKPQFYADVIQEVKDLVRPEQLIITIAPGKTLAWLAEQFGKDVKIVRTMPNTPAMVGEGMTAATPNEHVTKEELDYACKILSAFGKVEVVTEHMMDAVVAVSGSSPAYVFMFIEAMADAAVAEGMPRAQAYKFAAQAVLGSAKMVLETGKHPGELKDMVCSPAGTTIEAVGVLEEHGFRSAVIDAMKACVDVAKGM